jgi:hypothetical protein
LHYWPTWYANSEQSLAHSDRVNELYNEDVTLLEMIPEFIGALEAVTGSVAEAGQPKNLEELVGAIELAGEVSLLQVQPEQLLHHSGNSIQHRQ